MSKKLLSEAQVRRFQSLASISPLNEMYNEEIYEAEEEVDAAEEPADLAPVEMDDAPEEAPEMDLADADGEEVEVEEEMVEKAAAALGDLQALVDALGGEAAPADDMPDMGAEEPEMDLGAEEPAGDEDEEALLELALEGIKYEPSQKEIVKVVAKRVARRLLEAKRAQAKLNKALGKK